MCIHWTRPSSTMEDQQQGTFGWILCRCVFANTMRKQQQQQQQHPRGLVVSPPIWWQSVIICDSSGDRPTICPISVICFFISSRDGEEVGRSPSIFIINTLLIGPYSTHRPFLKYGNRGSTMERLYISKSLLVMIGTIHPITRQRKDSGQCQMNAITSLSCCYCRPPICLVWPQDISSSSTGFY